MSVIGKFDKREYEKVGKRDSYVIKHKFEGVDFKSLIDIVCSDYIPEINGYEKSKHKLLEKINSDSDVTNIKKIIETPLPNVSSYLNFVNFNSILIEYDICYCEDMLILKSSSPRNMSKKFEFSEITEYIKDGDAVCFKTEIVLRNYGKELPLIGDKFNKFTDDYIIQILSGHLDFIDKSKI